MRSSSVKSFLATLAILVFVTATAATANARPTTRPSQKQTTSVPRDADGPGDRLFRTIQRMYNKFKSVTSFALPCPPLPEQDASTIPAPTQTASSD